jgi:hypothetical protein
MKNFRDLLCERNYSERESYLNENLSQDARHFAIYKIIETVKRANDKVINELLKKLDIKIYLEGKISNGEKVKRYTGEVLTVDNVIDKKKVSAELKQILRDSNAIDNIKHVFEKNLINKDHEIIIECFERIGNGFEIYYEVQIADWTLRRAVQVNVS